MTANLRCQNVSIAHHDHIYGFIDNNKSFQRQTNKQSNIFQLMTLIGNKMLHLCELYPYQHHLDTLYCIYIVGKKITIKTGKYIITK